MSDYDEGYEDGYRDAQDSSPTAANFSRKSGEAFWAFASFGTVQPSEEYLKGYEDGWEAGTNDQSGSDDDDHSSSESWFGSASDDSDTTDDSREQDHHSSSPATSGGGGYSGDGGSYSGCGGSGTSTDTGKGALLGLLGTLFIGGVICWSSFGNSNKPKPPQQNQQMKAPAGLTEGVNRLSQYLNEHNQLIGTFSDYQLIIPPNYKPNETEYAIGFEHPGGRLYVFYTVDGGQTWSNVPGTNPYLIKIGNDMVEEAVKKVRRKVSSASNPASTTPEGTHGEQAQPPITDGETNAVQRSARWNRAPGAPRPGQSASREAMTYFWRAETECLHRNFEKAIADCSKAIELDPTFAKAYAYRGRAFNGKGDYDKAIADCTKAIELDPTDDEAYSNRAFPFYAKGDYDKAIADWSKAIELVPKNPWPYKYRGLAYCDKRDYDKAWADVKKCQALDGTVNSSDLDKLRKASGRGE